MLLCNDAIDPNLNVVVIVCSCLCRLRLTTMGSHDFPPEAPFTPYLLAILSIGGVRIIEINNSQDIAFKPLNLDPAHPGKRRIGELIFEGAWQLDSRKREF